MGYDEGRRYTGKAGLPIVKTGYTIIHAGWCENTRVVKSSDAQKEIDNINHRWSESNADFSTPDRNGKWYLKAYEGYQDVPEDITAFLKELGIDREYAGFGFIEDMEPINRVDSNGKKLQDPEYETISSPKYPDITLYFYDGPTWAGGLAITTPAAIKVMGENVIQDDTVIWDNIESICLDWNA